MKKLIYALFIGLLVASCAHSKKIVTESKPQAQKLEAEKTIVTWKQILYPKLAVGDPITFLNGTEIVLSGDFFNQTLKLENGNLIRTDTVHQVSKNVPKLTAGMLVSMKKANNGQIQQMNISFSENDATYNFNFQLKTDGSFTLNGNATLVFNEKEYKLQAGTKEECLLKVNLIFDQTVDPINGSAEGRPVSGTKIIKQ